MCGISCVIDPGSPAGLVTALAAMHRRIPHRGPDGQGFVYADGRRGVLSSEPFDGAGAGAAFRWLKIQDTSEEASQPFVSRDGRTQLLFNGEIYNFRQLRGELESHGATFTTHSDTEVVLAAWERWGTGCFARFRGMWAIVILDAANGVAVISRDRLGIKPLHYDMSGTRLRFASEVKQLAGEGAEADREMLLHFLAGSRVPDRTRTFFSGIAAVPPGTYCVVKLTANPEPPEFVRYWTLDVRQRARSFDDALDELRELLAEVIVQHITAEVPVATFLSGGIDSSVITAIAKARGANLPSLSMVLEPEFARYDEARYIASTARHLGVRNERVVVTGQSVRDEFDRSCAVHEEPLAGMAIIAQGLTYRLAAEHGIRVVLDGQGSDEEFAGYPRQEHEYLLDLLLRLRWMHGARELAAFVRHDPGDGKRFARYAASILVARPLRLRRRTRRTEWLAISASEAAGYAESERAASTDAPGATRLARMLWADTMSLNLYDVLGIGDRNSMAHSVESRVPFVDHVLTEFVFSLPDEMKVGAGWRKRILRRIAGELVPPEVAWRTDKMGFAVPQATWMRRHFAEELRGLADRDAVAHSPLVHRAVVRRMSEAFLAGSSEDAPALWRLLAAARWSEIYGAPLT